MYRTAAELRDDDPRAAESYRMAAWLYAASGNRGLARRLLAKAAESSAETGNALKDHTQHVIWLGPSETLKLDQFR